MTTSLRCAVLSASVAFVLASAAAPAAAQDPDRRHVSVGAAAGIAAPYHGDFEFTATAWQADLRVDTKRHFGFGVFFEEWRHSDERVLTDQAITGPDGPLGRVDRIVITTDHRTRVLGWNLLARGTAARVTFSGGGGVSYLLYSRDFQQTLSGCDPALLCRDTSNEFDNSSFAAQVHAGIDVEVAPHVAVMGQFRALFPMQDPGGGHNTIVGGVRVGF